MKAKVIVDLDTVEAKEDEAVVVKIPEIANRRNTTSLTVKAIEDTASMRRTDERKGGVTNIAREESLPAAVLNLISIIGRSLNQRARRVHLQRSIEKKVPVLVPTRKVIRQVGKRSMTNEVLNQQVMSSQQHLSMHNRFKHNILHNLLHNQLNHNTLQALTILPDTRVTLPQHQLTLQVTPAIPISPITQIVIGPIRSVHLKVLTVPNI